MVVAKYYDGVKHCGRVSETPCLPGENSQENSTNNELHGDAELITELINFEPEVCIRNGN